MSTLFLIGNGFDLNCGMKTAYTDIYPGYINEPSISKVISTFKQNISSQIDTWGDFEMAMADYAKTLNSESQLLECVRDFSFYVNDYLAKEELAIREYLKDSEVMNLVTQEMYNSFRDFYLDCSHNINHIMQERLASVFNNISAISFNYTQTFDTIFNQLRSLHGLSYISVTHIHGLLDEDPVLGIDNESQLNVSYPISKKAKRGFIKPFFNECYDRNRVRYTLDRIQMASTICTYGLSLGDSDLTWRNALLSWLDENDNHHLFIYDYRYSTIYCKTVSERLDIEDDAKEKLLAKWGVNSNIDSLLEQIHIPIAKNIFNIKPCFKQLSIAQ